ncbi:MAG: hypothetical protein HFP76_00365, partial [Methylococcales symbiont of Iophon sp. n. MRB-2018]
MQGCRGERLLARSSYIPDNSTRSVVALVRGTHPTVLRFINIVCNARTCKDVGASGCSPAIPIFPITKWMYLEYGYIFDGGYAFISIFFEQIRKVRLPTKDGGNAVRLSGTVEC